MNREIVSLNLTKDLNMKKICTKNGSEKFQQQAKCEEKLSSGLLARLLEELVSPNKQLTKHFTFRFWNFYSRAFINKARFLLEK
jgi:hypothetical protein